MTEFERVKSILKSTLEQFCQINDSENESPLDELEIDILTSAQAEALLKGTPYENQN